MTHDGQGVPRIGALRRDEVVFARLHQPPRVDKNPRARVRARALRPRRWRDAAGSLRLTTSPCLSPSRRRMTKNSFFSTRSLTRMYAGCRMAGRGWRLRMSARDGSSFATICSRCARRGGFGCIRRRARWRPAFRSTRRRPALESERVRGGQRPGAARADLGERALYDNCHRAEGSAGVARGRGRTSTSVPHRAASAAISALMSLLERCLMASR